MAVIIGVDPRKSSHTATALAPDLTEVGTIRLRASRSTIDQLLAWAREWPVGIPPKCGGIVYEE